MIAGCIESIACVRKRALFGWQLGSIAAVIASVTAGVPGCHPFAALFFANVELAHLSFPLRRFRFHPRVLPRRR